MMNGRSTVGNWRGGECFVHGVVIVLALLLSSCAREDKSQPRTNCKSQYGRYMSLAPNGDFAIDHCRDGVFGILLKTAAGERRLVSDKTKYMDPAFSPDGKIMAFVELDWTTRSSSIHLFDLRSDGMERVFNDKGVITHPVVTSDRKSVYFWHGQWRDEGRTLAAGFVLRRLSLLDGKLTSFGEANFGALKPSLAPDGSLHYAFESSTVGQYFARRITGDGDQPSPVELPKLGGPVVYTAAGYYYVARYTKKNGSTYSYCIVGRGIIDRSICPVYAFAIDTAGNRLVYLDETGQPTWVNLK